MQFSEPTAYYATKTRDALARVPDWMQLVLVIIVSSFIGILLGSYGISLQRLWSHISNEYPPRHRKGPSSLCPIPEAVVQGGQLQESWTVESSFQEDTLTWWMRVRGASEDAEKAEVGKAQDEIALLRESWSKGECTTYFSEMQKLLPMEHRHQ